MNIAEAMIKDLLGGNFRNVSNGMGLLGNMRNLHRQNGTRQIAGDMDLEVLWVQLHMVWNLSFCCSGAFPELLCKLLIPSVVDTAHPRWFERRDSALRMMLLSPSVGEWKNSWDLRPLQEHLALQAGILKIVHRQFIKGTVQRRLESFGYRTLSTLVRSFTGFAQWLEYLV